MANAKHPPRPAGRERGGTNSIACRRTVIPSTGEEIVRGTPRSVLPTHPTAATDGTHMQPTGGCIPSRTKEFETPANFVARSPEAASPQLYRPGTPTADGVSDGSASGLSAGLSRTARYRRPPSAERKVKTLCETLRKALAGPAPQSSSAGVAP